MAGVTKVRNNNCVNFLSFPKLSSTNYRNINILSQQLESKFKEGQVIQSLLSRMEKLRYRKIKEQTRDHTAIHLYI